MMMMPVTAIRGRPWPKQEDSMSGIRSGIRKWQGQQEVLTGIENRDAEILPLRHCTTAFSCSLLGSADKLRICSSS
jgi:hypothetical protein